MKKEFSSRPEKFTETWGGEFELFAWQDFVTSIPQPLFVVTGWKSNGKENACLQSWASFVSDSGEFICILSYVPTDGHMYKSLKETGVCVLNFPSSDVYEKCLATIKNNQFETDEITASGLTAESATVVNAPRIAECFLNIECRFLWEHKNFEGSKNTVVALQAVSISMNNEYYDADKLGRYGKTGYMYNILANRNPDTGEVREDTTATIEL